MLEGKVTSIKYFEEALKFYQENKKTEEIARASRALSYAFRIVGDTKLSKEWAIEALKHFAGNEKGDPNYSLIIAKIGHFL